MTLLSVPAPEAGEIVQVTPFCAGSYCTIAVNVWLLPAGTVAVLGLAENEEAFECIVEHYAQARGARPYVFRGSSPGADRFGVIELDACAS